MSLRRVVLCAIAFAAGIVDSHHPVPTQKRGAVDSLVRYDATVAGDRAGKVKGKK